MVDFIDPGAFGKYFFELEMLKGKTEIGELLNSEDKAERNALKHFVRRANNHYSMSTYF